MRILGIETSCDETAAAVVEDGRRVLSSAVAIQDRLHQPYGGVVPEIASRAHLSAILPVLHRALEESRTPLEEIDAVAVVNAPGLVGALLVGLTSAKTVSWLFNRPMVGVNHLHAHIYAAALDRTEPVFPCVSLVASGGHTSLFHSRSPVEHDLLGATLDDAAGEAFDKAASLLGLGYPGGPAIDRAAREGDRRAIKFPRTRLKADTRSAAACRGTACLAPTEDNGSPRAAQTPSAHVESLDFSFSGLKTAVLYHCRGPNGRQPRAMSEREKADVAASFQEMVVDALVERVLAAVARTQERRIAVGGGVAANSRLRDRLQDAAARRGLELMLPPMKYCVDNGAMVAGLAYHLLQAGRRDDLTLDVQPTSRAMR